MWKVVSLILDGVFAGFLFGVGLLILIIIYSYSSTVYISSTDTFDLTALGFGFITFGLLVAIVTAYRGSKLTVSS